MVKYSFLFLSLLLLIACGGETKKASDQKTPAATNKSAGAKAVGYKPIPQDLLMNIWNNGEMVDYIFHEPSFSMNQNEQNSIRANLTYVQSQGVESIPSGCKPRARQFYQAGGDIVLEADIYLDKNCQFYIFFVDGKPSYGNQMTPEGAEFFGNMIKQAIMTRDGIQNGG